MTTSALAPILADLVAQADAKPGAQIVHYLKRGLRLDVVRLEAHHALFISRTGDEWPSETEWKTCVDHWPYPVPPVTPTQERIIEDGAIRSCLHAYWPVQLALFAEQPDA